MKRKIIYMLVSCFICVFMMAAGTDAAERISREKWKKGSLGSAGVLEGRSILVSIFVDDGESWWTPAAKKKVNRKVGISGRYIGRQAKRYGKTVELVSDIYKNPDLCYSYQTKVKVNDSAKKQDKLYREIHGYIDQKLPLSELRKKYDTDSIGFLLHINKSGVSSTAVHYVEDKKCFYECASLFRRFDGISEGASTYAHEILHLFGARDLYQESLADGITCSFVKYVAKRHPNDIMFTTYTMSGRQPVYQIKNEISRVTAYYLGWKKKIPEKKRYPLMRGRRGCFSDGTGWSR